MVARIMVTNGPGGHPSWKHAEVTANKIVQVDQNASEEKQAAAAKLRRELEEALTQHHEDVKQWELSHIEEHGIDRCEHALAVENEHVDAVMETLANLTSGTILEDHFSKPEVLRIIREEILLPEFATQLHIHRSELADANRGHPCAEAYHTRHHGEKA